MASKNPQKTTRREIFKNPYEAGDKFVSKIKETAKDEFSKDWRIAMSQMLGVENLASRKEKSGDLREGEEIVFAKEKKVEIEAAYDYKGEVLHFEQKGAQKENYEIRVKIDEIKIELVKLAKSSKELEITFKNVTLEQQPINPGKYHLNFFEWMLVTIQNTRMRVEDSAAWLGVVSGKKNRKDYWSLSKKHGTSFSLSGERTAATQTG